MPELPEMQALAERVADALAAETLRAIQPIQFSALKTVQPGPESLTGRALAGTARRGKFLILDFDGPRALVHLSQGGRVDLERPPKATRPKIGVVRFLFEGAMFVKEFGTERKAAWWVMAPGDDGPLTALGPEPGDEAFADLILRGDDPRRIHTMLRDQRTVAGIGRGHSDDILHRAHISPYARLRSLGEGDRPALLDAVRAVLADALAGERTRTGGLPAKLSDRFVVHGRHGHPCPACGADLRRISYESHEITYCPSCQTGGKVLADRRMSRLIR
jgi:formamidopyrimidine-DNA glycosylase